MHIARAVSTVVPGKSHSSSSPHPCIANMRLWIVSMSAFGVVVRIVYVSPEPTWIGSPTNARTWDLRINSPSTATSN